MNWSAQQQRLLGAMGIELLVRAPADQVLRAGATAGETSTTFAAVPGGAANAPNFPALQLALRRAAGDHDVSALIDDLERLRREPMLKRALWPMLRALRRNQ